MFHAVDSPYLVPFDGSFRVDKAPTDPPKDAGNKAAQEQRLAAHVETLTSLQRRLYAQDQWSVLLVFQAMDAAGKDSTIRAVMSGINPAGCQVYSFKAPSSEERDHDFLWRTAVRLPERGRIGIFNRSYYEEVLIVRVHPKILDGQRLPHRPPLETLWEERLESIADHEKHLARNGTLILKFWLNVSPEKQLKRLMARLDDPDKNWKFSAQDMEERKHWAKYMQAYEDALRATSKPWAPWYAIPADKKPFMRATVAELLCQTLTRLDPQYPTLSKTEKAELDKIRASAKAKHR